ncbi:MAG: hypothetical protein IIC66_12000, partial [candidate division Zixibacteria bacterium]|nr:hypothetical protein [candidate division Zixibacteria bacterium]
HPGIDYAIGVGKDQDSGLYVAVMGHPRDREFITDHFRNAYEEAVGSAFPEKLYQARVRHGINPNWESDIFRHVKGDLEQVAQAAFDTLKAYAGPTHTVY